MTSTGDRRTGAGRRGRGVLLLLLLATLGTGHGRADGPPADTAMAQAHAALARGDGIAAEMALRKAMAAGAPHDAVAARMGEAYLDQGDTVKAREWLGPGRFVPSEEAHGFRVLGRLEMAEGNLAAAGQAFDRALQRTPDDSRLWVDIARLRYAGGEQVQAIAATDRAVALDPANVRALEYRGLLLRDQQGLTAALSWLEAGLKAKPDDLALLGEYAATLGELGRARQMVTVTRRMLELDPKNGRAFFLQAVLAARAGNVDLARALIGRAGTAAEAPAGLLLFGTLELQAGNANHAAELLERLSALQPDNRTARLLLARALDATGERRTLVDRFEGEALRPDASPYLQTLVARALEDLGQRERAAPLLDRAARAGATPILPLSPTGDGPPAQVRRFLAAGNLAEADAVAARVRNAAPGSADAQRLYADVRFARGDLAGAVEAWRVAATVALTDDLLLRFVDALLKGGRADEAERLVSGALATSPRDRAALRLSAGLAARRGDWGRAATVLAYLARTGDAADARVQSDLSFARLNRGDLAGARQAAEQAFRLQRASPAASRALGLVLQKQHQSAEDAQALLRKG